MENPYLSVNGAFPSDQAVQAGGIFVQYVPPRLRRSFCREVRDAIRKRVRRAQVVDGFVYSQILIAAQNPSGQLFAASEKPRRDLVPESNMLFIGAAASRGKSARYIRPYGECTDADPCWCQMDPGAACARFYAWAAPQTRTVGPSRAPI